MAASVLNSDRAVSMSVYVIRAFVEIREQIAANNAILKRLAEIDNTLLIHDASLRDIYKKLMPLLAPPPSAPRKQIGFHPLIPAKLEVTICDLKGKFPHEPHPPRPTPVHHAPPVPRGDGAVQPRGHRHACDAAGGCGVAAIL
jgi:hypothetical protein